MTAPHMPPARRREPHDRPLPHDTMAPARRDEQVPARRPGAAVAGCTCAYRFVAAGPGRVNAVRVPDEDCPQH